MTPVAGQLRTLARGLALCAALCVALGAARQQQRRGAPEAAELVVGKFRAPAPERVARYRVPSGAEFGAHTLSASFRVAERLGGLPEKTVHGLAEMRQAEPARQARRNERLVQARLLVSDEGLNYPPSKLSADIHGNVAELVTAPPDAVENDFLFPDSSAFESERHGSRR